ncbi:MAG: translation initiation factor IF-2 [Candidatus Paceibacterota bacterium]
MTKQTNNSIPRPPVIAIMGHIDHGKSSLLDYIRKSAVVAGEAGGITQHISAYEVHHKDESGTERTITFLDTPGHEAFHAMRSRGAQTSDIVVLVISAEEGVKPQTLEAYEAIQKSGTPYMIALTKCDKQNADPDKVRRELMEHNIFVEGLGGTISSVAISSVTGKGMDELLSTLLLIADLEGFTGNPNDLASGVVIETNRDPQKGISATLVVKNGTIRQGQAVLAGLSLAPVRIMENFLGKSIKEASFSSPIRITGWDIPPSVGDTFAVFEKKKEAEKAREEKKNNTEATPLDIETQEEGVVTFPLILKADVQGSIEAIEHEIQKISTDKVKIKIIQSGVGSIGEADVKLAGSKGGTTIVGFHVGIDSIAQQLADRDAVSIQTFDIIYRLREWLEGEVLKRKPIEHIEEITGKMKVLMCFSKVRDKQVIGGKMLDGILKKGEKIKVIRRENEIGSGVILGLQQQKIEVSSIQEGELGLQVESRVEITNGDILVAITTITK